MLKPSNSKMKTAIFIIFFLFIAINIVALTIVNWGGKERRLGLKTLHKSTMKKVSSQLNSNFAIFNNSKSVVIVQDVFKNDSVFFVDLINHTTKKLDLNQDKKLNISELIPLDDKVIAIYREGLEKNYAYIVDKSGNIKELSYIEEPLSNDPGKYKEIKDYLQKNFDV